MESRRGCILLLKLAQSKQQTFAIRMHTDQGQLHKMSLCCGLGEGKCLLWHSSWKGHGNKEMMTDNDLGAMND